MSIAHPPAPHGSRADLRQRASSLGISDRDLFRYAALCYRRGGGEGWESLDTGEWLAVCEEQIERLEALREIGYGLIPATPGRME